jgi:hypothetical protein
MKTPIQYSIQITSLGSILHSQNMNGGNFIMVQKNKYPAMHHPQGDMPYILTHLSIQIMQEIESPEDLTLE